MEFADLQASSRLTLEDGTIVTTCDRCRERYAERKPPGTPPCESCRVELREENQEVAEIYMLTRGQCVTAENGRVVDISIPAIKAAIDMSRKERDCLRKVQKVFHHFLGAQSEGS